MTFERDIYTYLVTNFIDHTCIPSDDELGVLGFKWGIICPVTDSVSVNGMPKVELTLVNGNKLSLDPKKFFLFPTSKKTTEPMYANFGLSYFRQESQIHELIKNKEELTIHNFLN